MAALEIPAATNWAKRARDEQRPRALTRIVCDNPELRDAHAAFLGRLQLSTCFDSGNSILITSAQPHEGKTTVACCLAITALLAGQTALLIDGDLRRPWLASAAGIGDAIGHTEILEGRTESVEAIHLVDLIDASREARPPGVMAAGRKSPTFLPAVDWFKARTVFRSISQRFGIVFLDSPPILAANDALLRAGIVDGVVLVVGAGSANRYDVQRAKEQLDPIGTPVFGAVLNQFDPKIHGRPNQPYRGFYLDSRP
jgi:capsular exopolysaccharide synthesis family protein